MLGRRIFVLKCRSQKSHKTVHSPGQVNRALAKKLKASEGEASLRGDHSDEASDSDEEYSLTGPVATKASSVIQAPLRAKCILAEYWGPKVVGRNRYSQRLFDVLYSHGTRHTLLAEDVVDGWAQPFESNPFYTEVLGVWRQSHPVKPVRPV